MHERHISQGRLSHNCKAMTPDVWLPRNNMNVMKVKWHCRRVLVGPRSHRYSRLQAQCSRPDFAFTKSIFESVFARGLPQNTTRVHHHKQGCTPNYRSIAMRLMRSKGNWQKYFSRWVDPTPVGALLLCECLMLAMSTNRVRSL